MSHLKCVVCGVKIKGRVDKKTCSDKCRKKASREYDAGLISIRHDALYTWERAIILAQQYNKDVGWIQRSLDACELAGVGYDYFIGRYLENNKREYPLNEKADKARRNVKTIY